MKNLGAQPILIMNMRLKCWRENVVEFIDYKWYERHILPPADKIAFDFDFTEQYQKKGVTSWTLGMCTFILEVVASDLSEEIILTYSHSESSRTLRVMQGMPLNVRWMFFSSFFKQRYYRILHRLKPPRYEFIPNDGPKNKSRIWGWLKGISILRHGKP